MGASSSNSEISNSFILCAQGLSIQKKFYIFTFTQESKEDDLFNYKKKYYYKDEFHIIYPNAGIFNRVEEKICFINNNQSLDIKKMHYQKDLLCKLQYDKLLDQYFIDLPKKKIIDHSVKQKINFPWLSIKFSKEKEIYIGIDDCIKIGRTILKIKSYKINSNINNNFSNLLNNDENIYSNIETEGIQDRICRICLNGDLNQCYSSENPLLSLQCKCRGSINLIHLICLKKWFCSKINMKKKDIIRFCKKDIICDICKGFLGYKYKTENKTYNILDYILPSSNYVVFKKYENFFNAEIIIANIQKKKYLNIGRSEISNIYLTDETVSRNHSQIQIFNDKLILKDCNSKYGTLINLKNSKIFDKNNCQTFQLGRTLFNFTNNIQEKINIYHYKNFNIVDKIESGSESEDNEFNLQNYS